MESVELKIVFEKVGGSVEVTVQGEGLTEDEVAGIIDDLCQLEEEESMMFEWARRRLG